MRKACLLFLITAFCLAALQTNAQIKWDASKFMPLSEIKPGMRGEAYTVFSGTTVEAFDFEVVSIQYNFLPQLHIIWVKGIGENFEVTGPAGGMSGSPAYIPNRKDGRLIGAVSWMYLGQREHANLVGFTPIELMIEVTKRGMRPNLSYRGGSLFNFGSDTAWSGTEMLPLAPDEVQTRERKMEPLLMHTSGDIGSARLPIPVAFSGIPAQAMGILKPLFDKYHLSPIQGSGGSSPIKNAPIEPGQIVGIEYARGDFTAFGYGTMTYIDDNQLIGFGHAMFGEGNVNLPISGGYVHFIVPSLNQSFKVASPTKPIGTLVQDRQSGIAGLIGSHPSFIPVDAKIETMDGQTHAMHYEVMRHRNFSALVTMIGVWNLINGIEISSGDHSVNIDSKISLKDQPDLVSQEIVRRNVYSSSGSPGLQAALSLSPLSRLIGNEYAKVDIESVDINIKIEDKRKTAVIEGIRINKDRYRPGEKMEITIRMRPYLEAPIIQTGYITIPNDAPEGLTTILVISAASYETWQQTRAPLNYRPTNVNQLIKLLQREENNSDIILELFVPRIGMTIQGEEFPELPVSMLSVMSSPTQSGEGGFTRGTTMHFEKVPTPYVVSGAQFLRFRIDRNAP
ncbi:MAG: hypothetical protein O7E52_27000 [Candidatus Poribacteria bacterium]|nr:hypothetical protein [Candidatus Poribacteria bacterium]